MEDSHIKYLLSRIKCGMCGQRYQNAMIEFMGSFEEFSYFQITCQICKTQALVTAVVQKDKDSQIVTDVTVDDLVNSDNRTPVSADDLLDMINYLKYFDGDFTEIFPSKS
jgi:hypothetical protein